MPDKSRIPSAIIAFHNYINTSDSHLQAADPNPPNTPNWQRLGLTMQNATDWHNYQDDWKNKLYKKYNDPNTRTKTVNAQVRSFIAQFREFGMPLLEKIAASEAVTEADSKALHFILRRKQYTRQREALAEQCHASLLPAGGGRLGISCRTGHDTKRPSLAARADSVLIAFKTGDSAPRHSADGTSTFVSTRAKFTYDFGVENAGKRVHIFFRWYNTRRPDLAGPWSELESTILY